MVDPPEHSLVRYTVMALPTDPAAVLKPLRRSRERWPNGTYEFRMSDVVDALERIAATREWQSAPQRGHALIRTWKNRHPRTLLDWLQRAAANGQLIEVPHDAAPTWLSVTEDLVERQLFVRMTCPRCSREYLPADLEMQRWSLDALHYKGEGRKWLCPGGHELLSIAEWWMHHTERAQSFWRRED